VPANAKPFDGREVTMRARAFLYLLIGIVAIGFAFLEFRSALYFGWRTVAPIGIRRLPHGSRSRRPTDEEAREFAEASNRQLRYTSLWVLAALVPFGAFGRECVLYYRSRRRPPPGAVEHTDPASGAS
jgi:hypothetical protein